MLQTLAAACTAAAVATAACAAGAASAAAEVSPPCCYRCLLGEVLTLIGAVPMQDARCHCCLLPLPLLMLLHETPVWTHCLHTLLLMCLLLRAADVGACARCRCCCWCLDARVKHGWLVLGLGLEASQVRAVAAAAGVPAPGQSAQHTHASAIGKAVKLSRRLHGSGRNMLAKCF